MTSWLDTETKALLDKTPPSKLAPSDTVAFTLILLSVSSPADQRIKRAVERILLTSHEDAACCLERDVPIVVKCGLIHADALLGQFELVCCDAVSVFISDDVVNTAAPKYLDELYSTLLKSDEFAQTSIRIDSLPADDHGKAFVDQFLGTQPSLYPVNFVVPHKKARIMNHWVAKIGGRALIS